MRLDEDLMRKIATTTGGQYFNVRDPKGMAKAMGIPLGAMPVWDPHQEEFGGNTREAVCQRCKSDAATTRSSYSFDSHNQPSSC